MSSARLSMSSARLSMSSARWRLVFVPLALLSLTPPAMGRGDRFREARSVLEDAVAEGAFPGCSVVVGSSRRQLWSESFGRLAWKGEGVPKSLTESAPDENTLWDLASLTKVIGTTSVVLALVYGGRLDLRDSVVEHLPEFVPERLDAATLAARRAVRVEHLLAHCAGLVAWRPFYTSEQGLDGVLRAAVEVPLRRPPGEEYVYSDLGFIILGELVARVGGKPLAELERELIFSRLGMRDTLRLVPAAERVRTAPTERTPAGVVLHGVVHDENARAATGWTGHAGLFSTARDVSRFARELLRGRHGESELFPMRLLEEFTQRRGLVPGSRRGLGWETPDGRNSAGSLLSATAFGHTGFTGTSLWIDPVRDVYVVLLTNRVHPTRENRRLSKVRRDLMDAVIRDHDAARALRRRRI